MEDRAKRMSKQAFDAKIAALEALRAAPDAAAAPLRKALADRNNYIVSKAAGLAGDLLLSGLIPN